jgi:hypothetical protein
VNCRVCELELSYTFTCSYDMWYSVNPIVTHTRDSILSFQIHSEIET